MTTAVVERPGLIKALVEQDVHVEIARLAREHERSIAGEVRTALNQYIRQQAEADDE